MTNTRASSAPRGASTFCSGFAIKASKSSSTLSVSTPALSFSAASKPSTWRKACPPETAAARCPGSTAGSVCLQKCHAAAFCLSSSRVLATRPRRRSCPCRRRQRARRAFVRVDAPFLDRVEYPLAGTGEVLPALVSDYCGEVQRFDAGQRLAARGQRMRTRRSSACRVDGVRRIRVLLLAIRRRPSARPYRLRRCRGPTLRLAPDALPRGRSRPTCLPRSRTRPSFLPICPR